MNNNELNTRVLTKVKNRISENTVIMQELGHYMANAYYKTNSHSKYIEQMERLADITAWEEFLPYEEVKSFMTMSLWASFLLIWSNAYSPNSHSVPIVIEKQKATTDK